MEPAQKPIEDPQAEALLAVLGVDPVLEPGRVRITQDHRNDAAALPMRLAREIKRFLTQADYESGAELRPFKYREALELLTDTQDAARVEELVAATFDDEQAMGLALIGGQAVKYLRDVLPKRVRMTVLGPEPVEPSGIEVARFRRIYEAVNDPMSVLRDMADGVLTRDQAQALERVYPSLYALAKAAVFDVLVQIKATRTSPRIPRRKVSMLENLLLTRTTDPAFSRQLQAAFQQADPAEEQGIGSPTGKAPDIAQGLQTTSQRVAGG